MIPENVIFNSWTIDRNEWDEIERLFSKYNINSVVEFGGGVSSICLSRYISKHMIYEKHEPTINSISDINATILRRDIKVRLTDEQIKQDMELMKVESFDLAFVDAPPAFRDSMLHNGHARFFSVEAAKKMSNMILIHDTKRKGEQKTIETLLSDWTRIELKSKRGLTLFVKDGQETIPKPKKRGKRDNRYYQE